MSDRPTLGTLGELRAAGYRSRSVKEEMRANLVDRLRRGESLLPGIIGYDETVIPQVENAILAGQDIILLGERGQAKSRIARSLVGLLDEWMPVVAGAELHDDPLRPVSPFARALVAEQGDATPIAWVAATDRYGEKLATPDISIADLVGEVRKLVEREDPAVRPRQEPVVDRQLVGEIAPLRDLDGVHLADEIGDGDVRRRELLRVAPLGRQPHELDRVAVVRHPVPTRGADRIERLVVDLAAGDRRHGGIEERHQ